jgi:outer membrane lipoprotein-sorting protein
VLILRYTFFKKTKKPMKNPLFLYIAAALLTISSTFTQDPKAQAILDQVTKTYGTATTLQASFTLQIENKAQGIKETKRGKIAQKGKKFNVDLGKQRLICDGKKTYTHLIDLKEVQINDYEADNQEDITPSNFFSFYKKGFTYTYGGEQTMGGKKVQLINLIPTNKKKNYSKVELFINKKNQVEKARIFEKNGSKYTIAVTNVITNKPIDDQLFVFDKKKYPGIEITDLSSE